VPQSQRVKVKRAGKFDRIAAVRANRIYGEDLAASPREFVLTFRGSMDAELERAGCLRDAAVAWSMWRGYLDQPSSARLRDWLARNGLPLHHLHSSGHASVADLKRLAEAVGGRVVPIHTNAPERFTDLFSGVERHRDGEWWTV
jgi:ribonuclease J